ncbi:hypothetical protein TcG_12681, partial [Trypanosoma cruzi]
DNVSDDESRGIAAFWKEEERPYRVSISKKVLENVVSFNFVKQKGTEEKMEEIIEGNWRSAFMMNYVSECFNDFYIFCFYEGLGQGTPFFRGNHRGRECRTTTTIFSFYFCFYFCEGSVAPGGLCGMWGPHNFSLFLWEFVGRVPARVAGCLNEFIYCCNGDVPAGFIPLLSYFLLEDRD